MSLGVTAVIAMTILAMPAHAGSYKLTAADIQEIADKIGQPVQAGGVAGGAFIRPRTAPPVVARSGVGPLGQTVSGQPIGGSAPRQATAPQARSEQTAIGTVERHEYQSPIYRGKLTRAQALEKRSYEIFPRAPLDADENSKRVQWLVDQEQRAIANDINRTKPLVYPVSGR